MKKFRLISCFVILLLSATAQKGLATQAYVTDTIEITFRTGPSVENKIITFLLSGQLLEILESQKDWSRVRVLGSEQNDMEGWVLSRYLTKRKPWEMQAVSLKKENALLREKLAQIEMQWQETAGKDKLTSEELKEKVQELQRTRVEYEKLRREASGFLELKTVHESTRRSLKATQQTVQELTKDNERLRSSQKNNCGGDQSHLR